MMDFDRQLRGISNDLNKAYTSLTGMPMAKATMAGAFGTPKDDDEAPGEMVSGTAFMAKALAAHKAGYITSQHLTTAEMSINAGKRPPPKIVKAVMTEQPYADWD